MLDIDSIADLNRRAMIGEACIELAHDGSILDIDDDERATFASDAISDILTALFGPAGISKLGGKIEYDENAVNAARALLARAFESYQGDAEDYWAAPENG